MKPVLSGVLLLSLILISCSTTAESQKSSSPSPQTTGGAAETVSMDGEAYRSAYLDMLEGGEYDALPPLLGDWERDFPEDPEMFIAFFNYFLNRNISSGMSLQQGPPPEGEHLALSDPETGEIVGYMADSTVYDPDDVAQALSWLNRGLALAPDRLDMHFGKIHILQEIGDYSNESAALADCLNRSGVNGNAWLWSQNEELEEGFYFLVNNIQDYYSLWLNVQSEESLDALRDASAVQLEIYPDHIYAYNNISFSYLLRGDLETGLAYLLRAEEIDGDDVIVLNNIALCYMNLGDRENARLYFTKLLDYPEEVDKAYVEQRLENL